MPFSFRGIELPEHVRESIDAYATEGRPTGGFLQAVIDNDLALAVMRADDENVRIIPAIVGYLYNCCPSRCHGFADAFEEWTKEKYEERQAARKESNQ